MDDFTKACLKYLLIGLVVAFILALILLIYKINFKKCSIISIFFAFFFLIAYIFQPFLITLDYALFIYESNYLRERNYKTIDQLLTLTFRILGNIGFGFSFFFLPVYKYYYFSGYFRFKERLKDAFKRYFLDIVKYYILVIIGIIVLIISLILYFSGNEKFILDSKDLLLNCSIIPGIIKCLLYIGSYLPILYSELKLTCPDLRTSNYEKILNGVINEYLEEDKKKLIKAYSNLKSALKNSIISEENQKTEIQKMINYLEKNKESLTISLEIEENKGVITFDTFYHILCDSITEIKETTLTLPRKLYVCVNIKKKLNKTHGKCYFLYPLFMIFLGLFILLNECFGNAIEFSEIKDEYNRMHVNSCLKLFIFLIFYYISVYFCVIKRNSISNHMLYGKRDSDTLCLLNFATEISGLISPVSFIVLYSNIFGIYYYENKGINFYPQNNMVYTRINKYIIIENIRPFFNLDISFKDTFWIYAYSKTFIILLFLVGTFLFHSLTMKVCFFCCCNKWCCKKKKYERKFSYIFNDKNEKFCKCLRKETYEDKGEKDPLIELMKNIN